MARNEFAFNGENAEYITLDFDDKSVEVEVMGTFEVNGKEYIALIPQDESDDVYLYIYRQLPDGEFEMYDITNDVEFERVSRAFYKLMEQD